MIEQKIEKEWIQSANNQSELQSATVKCNSCDAMAIATTGGRYVCVECGESSKSPDGGTLSVQQDGRQLVNFGQNVFVEDGATVGFEHTSNPVPTDIGANSTIRAGSIIYCNVTIGDDFTTGHGALVREETSIGDDVLVGTQVVIDGYSKIGSYVSLQTGVYLPSHTTVGNNVFIGPHAVVTNDRYPVRRENDNLEGPVIKDGASIGANATILPGVTIGENAFVAAGAVVNRDVPPDTLAVGVPAEDYPLPTELQGSNRLNK